MKAQLKEVCLFKKDRRFKDAFHIRATFVTDDGVEFNVEQFIGKESNAAEWRQSHQIVDVFFTCQLSSWEPEGYRIKRHISSNGTDTTEEAAFVTEKTNSIKRVEEEIERLKAKIAEINALTFKGNKGGSK